MTRKYRRWIRVRSGLEARVSQDLKARGIPFRYESQRLGYTQARTYTTDFAFPNGVVVETKGYFSSEDRTKLLLVRKAHPDLDLRILFQRASNKLSSTSKTTYGMWATKNCFEWAEGDVIPEEWVH